jgi:hypothetical protein
MAGFMSFIARGLNSIPGHLFCYSAISSAAIVGILPGYLIRKFLFIPALQTPLNNLIQFGVHSNSDPRTPFVEQ